MQQGWMVSLSSSHQMSIIILIMLTCRGIVEHTCQPGSAEEDNPTECQRPFTRDSSLCTNSSLESKQCLEFVLQVTHLKLSSLCRIALVLPLTQIVTTECAAAKLIMTLMTPETLKSLMPTEAGFV